MTIYPNPGTEGSNVKYRERYDNYIGGDWVAPVDGEYFDNITPVTGEVFCQVARGKEADINLALDAAHKAAPAWGKTSPAERAMVLLKIADRMEEHLEELAVAETWENGKAVRETLAADIPLAVDHFRYYAGALRAQEGRLSQIDEDTVAYHFNEPLGVVGQIIPWNFPLLMAAWKLAPALAAGNAIVLKPAEQTPASILYLTTVFKGTNDMRIFQEEIFGPVMSVTTFKDFDEAISIANDTIYGLGAGVWARSGTTAYKAGRAIQAGRVWVNQYHTYPAHAAFGGYKQSGIGRETHLMMLDHYQQTKNLLVSYSEQETGLF